MILSTRFSVVPVMKFRTVVIMSSISPQDDRVLFADHCIGEGKTAA